MTDLTLNRAWYPEPTNTLIDFNVTWNGNTFDFTYSPTDPEPLSLAIRDMIAANNIPPIAPYVAPADKPAGAAGEKLA